MMLNKDVTQITRMELDLREKIQFAIDSNPDLNMGVFGVFSLDDLEHRLESDLGGGIGVGVQYLRTERVDGDTRPGATSARYLRYSFTVILAVPSGLDAAARTDATTLLTMLRNSIFGQPVADDRVTRTWDFIQEQAEPGASTATMLYYSQLWQLALPLAVA